LGAEALRPGALAQDGNDVGEGDAPFPKGDGPDGLGNERRCHR
jgi:hypothetical protein